MHRGVIVRETDGSGMVRDVADADRPWLLDKKAKDPTTSRQGSDFTPLPGGNPGRYELHELLAVSNHPERPISGVGDLCGQIDYPLQNDRKRELRCQGQSRLEERVLPVAALGHYRESTPAAPADAG